MNKQDFLRMKEDVKEYAKIAKNKKFYCRTYNKNYNQFFEFKRYVAFLNMIYEIIKFDGSKFENLLIDVDLFNNTIYNLSSDSQDFNLVTCIHIQKWGSDFMKILDKICKKYNIKLIKE